MVGLLKAAMLALVVDEVFPDPGAIQFRGELLGLVGDQSQAQPACVKLPDRRADALAHFDAAPGPVPFMGPIAD